MASWSTRRKTIYSSVIIFTLIILVIIPGYLVFHKNPTCFDGIKNGNESGIDCGGSCVKLCQNTFLPPRITWGGAKFEKVATGLYNIGTYIENQNIGVAAEHVPYKMSIYDTAGNYIAERDGFMDIPPHRNTLVFEGAVDVGKRIPGKINFEFAQAPLWFKSHDTLGNLATLDKQYTEDDKSSSLQVTFQNNGIVPYTNLSIGAVLYDANDNAIGFSKTVIDQIAPNGGKEIAGFTWPIGRGGKVTSIEILPVTDAPHDR